MYDSTNYMQSIGLALLAILIPFAIAILTDILQKKRHKDKEFSDLDLHVALDNIIRIKYLLLYVVLVFVPPIFWRIAPLMPECILFVPWIVGFIATWVISLVGNVGLAKTIVRQYSWTKGNVWDFRISYLKSLTTVKDLEIVWRSVWETENIDTQKEKQCFEIFSSVIDKMLQNTCKENSLKSISNFLSNFSLFIKHRPINFLFSQEVFPKILEWHYTVWAKQQHLLGKENLQKEWAHYSEVLRFLDTLMAIIEERALKEHVESYLFFHYLNQHCGVYKNHQEYLSHLLDNFYRIFFEHIHESPGRHSIWMHYFPAEWKITKNNLEKENNSITLISLANFLHWASERIFGAKEKYDFVLDDANRNLFPEVDPITWAELIIFVLSPYDPANRIRSIINKPWSFGFIGRTKIFVGEEPDYRKSHETELRNTFELLYTVAKFQPLFNQFSEENLKIYISELKSLEYESNSIEEIHRSNLLYICTKMLEILSSR